jgi:hypothetical protein
VPNHHSHQRDPQHNKRHMDTGALVYTSNFQPPVISTPHLQLS